MLKFRNFTALVALGSLAALPACSMFGGGDSHASRASSNSSYASNAPNYSTGPSSSMAQSASQPMSPDMTRQVQEQLQQQGTYRGPVDGVWGPQTQSAVRNYQQAHGLSTTGKLDMDTLASLNLAPSSNQSSNGQPQRFANGPDNSTNATQPYNPPPNQPAAAQPYNPPPTQPAR